MSKDTHRGYIGLIVLLISVAVFALLFMTTYFTPRTKSETASTTPEGLQPTRADGKVPETVHEEYRADIDAAHKVQDIVNTQAKGFQDQ